MFCNVLVPQIFWFRSCARSLAVMCVAAILVNVGHVVRALHHHRHRRCTATSCPRRWATYYARPGWTGASSSARWASSAPLPALPALLPRGRRQRGEGAAARPQPCPRAGGGPLMALLVLAEFSTPAAMMDAARALRKEGVLALDGYAPYPVHGLEDALGLKKSSGPAARRGGRAGRHRPRLFAPVVSERRQLPTGRRRKAAARPADVHPSHVRAGHPHHRLLHLLRTDVPDALLGRTSTGFEVPGFREAPTTHAFWLSAEVATRNQSRTVASRLQDLGALQASTVEGEP